MADLYDAFALGEVARARELHFLLWPLMKALFIETNPIPAKTALAMMGKIAKSSGFLCAGCPTPTGRSSRRSSPA